MSDGKYAVLNTERNVFLSLGQFGPHYTTEKKKAARQATDVHLKLIKFEFADMSESQSDD